jgi:murein L,D-transpeptidase YafK
MLYSSSERAGMTRRKLFLLPAAAALKGAQTRRPAGNTSWVEEAAKTEAHIRSWAAAQDDYAILVDKLRYDLYVLLGAQVIARLPVELGHDPVNRKEREGDMRTPEGVYSVVFRREKGSSFYKDLMLDYPNENNRWLGRTGSAIEVHGSGTGRRPTEGGQNWTFGCIALSNGDVDYLFNLAHGAKRIRKGTPVGIVHSLAQALPVAKAVLPQNPAV